jgi:hypothetical protein
MDAAAARRGLVRRGTNRGATMRELRFKLYTLGKLERVILGRRSARVFRQLIRFQQFAFQSAN